MKFTLNDCITRINQVLNYPSVSYEDIYHFFDQAIAELNTSLYTDIPNVSEMRSENTFTISEKGNVVRLTTKTSTIPRAAVLPDSNNAEGYIYVCEDGKFVNRAFYVWDGGWVKVNHLYGLYVDYANNVKYAYEATALNTATAEWIPVEYETVSDFELTDYLPMEWWTLFIIPYVCFKFAIRDGDSGEVFSDEFAQGFQQLQNSYHVPSTVRLSQVAGHPAYATLVKENIYDLTKSVNTRAITKSMKLGTSVRATYGGFYESGGWGV